MVYVSRHETKRIHVGLFQIVFFHFGVGRSNPGIRIEVPGIITDHGRVVYGIEGKDTPLIFQEFRESGAGVEKRRKRWKIPFPHLGGRFRPSVDGIERVGAFDASGHQERQGGKSRKRRRPEWKGSESQLRYATHIQIYNRTNPTGFPGGSLDYPT